MIFTIDPEFIAKVFERYEQAFTGLAQEWGIADCDGELPSKFQNYFSPGAHCQDHVKSLFEEAFWASLEKEEGRCHSLQLVYCNNELADDPFVFADPLPFDADHLAKLSPAIPKSAAIGVWPDTENNLRIWGFEPKSTTNSGPCLRVEVLHPGTIIMGCGGESYFIALLTRKDAAFVDDTIFEPIKRRLEDSAQDLGPDSLGTKRYFQLLHVARAMRSHGHGGTLLVVPEGKAALEKSISSWNYKADSAFEQIRESVVVTIETPTEHRGELFANYQQSLDLVGQLTAVDGATVVTRDLGVLGFGAKIACEYDPDAPVRVSNPLTGSKFREKKITELGGTRHQSAARFVGVNKDSIAIVASQDGKVSFLAWDNDGGFISMTEHAEWQRH